MSRGYDRWDDQQDTGSQPRGSRRWLRGRTHEDQAAPGADESYGYSSGGDGYQTYGDYQQEDYPAGGYGNGTANGYRDEYGQGGYGQDSYSQDSYSQDSYGRESYADDGYGGASYRDDGYRGGGYADDGYGRNAGYGAGEGYPARDPYASQDPYSTGDPYGAQDPYAGDQYGSQDAYARSDRRDSSPHGMTDPRGLTDPYRRDRDPYEPAGAAGYGGQDRYDSPAGYDSGAGYDAPDESYGWADAGDRRDSRTASAVDPDVARHEGFFRGFGQEEDFDRRRPRKAPRQAKQHKSHAGVIALVIVLVIIAGIGGVGYHLYSEYKARHSSYTGSGFGAVKVFVKAGDTGDTIGPQLLRLGVIKAIDPWASYVANKSGLQPGEFTLHKHMSPAAAWALLINPKSRVSSKVTIPDGLRESKFLPLLAKESGLPLSQFESAIKNIAALGLPSYANGNPEGYLYPDTYDITPGQTTALKILQNAVSQFNAEATSLNLVAASQQAQFTPSQVITEASLLEAEVGPQYYAQVARVIDNRLNQGMKLQLDSTVAYATGAYIYDLTQSELNVNSPYNTFLHTDLPPGPIDSPDAAAIQAVLHPAPQNGDLYFVTVNKQGLTEFTSSYSQFQAWQAEAKANGV